MTNRAPSPMEKAGPAESAFFTCSASDENCDMLMYEPPTDGSAQKISKLRPLSLRSASSRRYEVSSYAGVDEGGLIGGGGARSCASAGRVSVAVRAKSESEAQAARPRRRRMACQCRISPLDFEVPSVEL